MKLKEMVTKVKNKLFLLPAMLTIALSRTVTAYAATLWDSSVDNGITNFVDNIAALYQKWSLPFIFVDIILLACTKDEKKREIEKRAAIILVVVYIVSFLYGTITGSITNIAENFKTGTGPAPTP